jgi:hypothetical protein
MSIDHQHKSGAAVGSPHAGTSVDDANAAAVKEKCGNQYDEMDMDRMGKLQELRVSAMEAGTFNCIAC